MKYWSLFLLLLSWQIFAQPDTLDLDKGEPILLMDPAKLHVPNIHATAEFQKLKHERDSLETELLREQNQPFGFGLQENGLVKIYLRSGACTGFPIEYHIVFSKPEKTGISKYTENQLKNIDLLVVRLHNNEKNDTLYQDHGLYAITFNNESGTAQVEIEGAIMNQLCTIEPIRVNCPQRGANGLYELKPGEIGLTEIDVPTHDRISKCFLLNKDVHIVYPDSSEITLKLDDRTILRFELTTRQNGGIFFSTDNDGQYQRNLDPYSYSVGSRLMLPDKKHKITVCWNEGKEVICTGKFTNLKPVAKWKYYYPNGTLRATGKYKQFKNQDNFSDQIGKWKYYHPNGQLMAQGSYVLSNDPNIEYTVLNDDWEFYDPQGNRVTKRDIVKLYEPKEVIMPLPDYLEEMRALIDWDREHGNP